MQSAKILIVTNTPSTDTSIEIALGSSAVNGTEQTIANENTAPTGVTFSSPSSLGTAYQSVIFLLVNIKQCGLNGL